MSRKSLFKWILLILSVGGLNLATAAFLMPAEWATILNGWEFLRIGNRRGFLRRTFVDESGHPHRYVVFLPRHLQGSSRPPLLVFLHGKSGNGDDGIQHIHECLGPPLWDMRDTFPFVVLFPQCPAGSNWSPTDPSGRLTMALTRKTLDEYKIDSDRVYLTGVSSGGTGAWQLAASFPDVFAAVIPISGRVQDLEVVQKLVDESIPVWNFHVLGDDLEEQNRWMHSEQLKLGGSPISTEIDGLLSDKWWKHDAWGVAYRSQATYRWLLSQSRSGNLTKKGHRFSKILSEAAGVGGNQITDQGWSIDDEGCLGTSGLTSLSHDTKLMDYELHFEFRYGEGSSFELSFPSGESKGVSVRFVLPEKGRGGVYSLDSQNCLQMPEPAAQRGIFGKIWNDVRVRINGDHLVICVNGWPLHDLRNSEILERTGLFSIGAPSEDTSIQWRNFRIREVKL